MRFTSLIATLGLLTALPVFAQTTTVPNPLAPDAPANAHAAHPAAPNVAAPRAATPARPAGGKTAQLEQAPGGGNGKVWVNTSSKVYHCEGGKYYGKTKKGEYMMEADAKARGFHGEGGKSCAAKS